LKDHLYLYDINPSITDESDFQVGTLDEAKKFLKHAYELIEFCKANLLAKTISVGLWLEKAHEMYLEIHPTETTVKRGGWV